MSEYSNIDKFELEKLIMVTEAILKTWDRGSCASIPMTKEDVKDNKIFKMEFAINYVLNEIERVKKYKTPRKDAPQ